MRILKTFFIGVLFLIALIFAAENTGPVEIHYYGIAPLQLPLFLVIFVAILLGILIAGLISSFDKFRLKREMNRLKRVVKTQEEELNSLRNLPLDAEGGGETEGEEPKP